MRGGSSSLEEREDTARTQYCASVRQIVDMYMNNYI
jgi:hypothetical protein